MPNSRLKSRVGTLPPTDTPFVGGQFKPVYLALVITLSASILHQAVYEQQAQEIGLSAEEQLKVEEKARNKRRFEAAQDFKGLKLGLGFAISRAFEDDRVESADVVDGKVRVTEEANAAVHAVGEIHRFTVRQGTNCTEDNASDCGRWGHGPFFSLQTGDNDVIEAAGLGYMVGFRQDADKSQSLNIGLALVLDPSVKVLGDDVRENQAPPGKETTVRLKETHGLSMVVVVSFGF